MSQLSLPAQKGDDCVAAALAPWCRPWLRLFIDFDSTAGFPGEGPDFSGLTSLVSANIGSIATNPLWKTWDADIVCLQETRVGKNNHRSAVKNFQTKGWNPCLGALLPCIWHKSGSSQTPCGGTLVAAPDSIIRGFQASQDHAGLFEKLHKTRRVAIAWCQVTSYRFALVISVYAHTGASQDPKIHDLNNCLFDDILTFASQFGRIPVILAGDLQAAPLSYPVLANALNVQAWADPISSTDVDGEVTRPLTFSNDGTFSGPGDSCTSIDAVLVNDIAFAALQHAEVMQQFGRQHRPIRLTFNWPSLEQIGYIHFKTAPFDLSKVHFEENDLTLPSWETTYQAKFEDAPTSDSKWDVVNNFLTDTILARGASWGEGPQKRAVAPSFVKKKIAPKQLLSRCAATAKSSKLAKVSGRLQELTTRLSRTSMTGEDSFITRRLACKTYWNLRDLAAPVGWPNPCQPTLTEVYLAKVWADAALATTDAAIRLQRIKRWKKRIHDSAQSNCAYIFQHLKNKLQDEPPNLVFDDDGNVIFQPEQALGYLNSAWDDVYPANVLSEHPLKMLELVWPYIKDQQLAVDLPPVSAGDLRHVLQKRKHIAAPGLDGWRTQELKCFCQEDLEPVAKFFAIVETSDLPLPKALVCAKQVILNKPGPATPMNKRLITVLPALLLAYTGSRFAQLQQWQQEIMPTCILGGIRGRTMSTLYNDMRLHIGCAKLDQVPLVGIKLDKAKAFDRIIPTFAGVLFLAFGIPQGIVSVFLKMYQGLHRHLSYRKWVCPLATHPANGVAQGCSLSLLAMNAYNKVWCHLLEHIPEIFVRAFIDDAYLWARLEHSHLLQKALEVTAVWDKLVGQKLNAGKSSMWSTTSQGRQETRAAFPEYPVKLEIEVLGTKMYVSDRQSFCFEESRLRKVLEDTDNIAALPVPHHIRVFLVSSKIVPQIAFGSHISKIPKRAGTAIQNAIARALWVGRPKWRAKHLLQAVLSAPHRTDPKYACAFSTVVETIRMCHTMPHTFEMLKRTWMNPHGVHSLAAQLQNAADVLGIEIDDRLALSFCGSQPVPLCSLNAKDASKVLANITRDACYKATGDTKRKDFHSTQRVFDYQQTLAALKQLPLRHKGGDIADRYRLESILVGCTLTNDRLAGSGWTDTSDCRFCQSDKESMHHLVYECTALHAIIGPPAQDELGANFQLLGHVEHPRFIAKRRLHFSHAADLPVAPDFDGQTCLRFWTDGSLVHGNKFWLMTATFAVVNEDRQVVKQGLVSHWSISAYTAELWAVLWVCITATTKVHIFSDCLTVVQRVHHICQGGSVDLTWSCSEWWKVFAAVLTLRQQHCPQPFVVTWIPAHCLERVPDTMLTDDLAFAAGSTVEHILHNRLCDRTAKALAQRLSPVQMDIQVAAEQAVHDHQAWLIRLHALLPTHETCHTQDHIDSAMPEEISKEVCQARFGQWPWGLPKNHYSWKPKIPKGCEPPVRWRGHPENWIQVCKFLSGLRWKLDPDDSFSFCELAVTFHNAGFRIVGDLQFLTFYDIYKVIRDVMLQLSKLDNVQAFAGTFNTAKPRSCGRVLPQGCIDGASPFHTDDCRVLIARAFAKGAGRELESWKLPVCDF